MKLLCAKSGLFYEVPEFGNFGSRYTLIAAHPIFSLPVEALLAQAGKWSSGDMNERERKLLFLALLASLEDAQGKLVTFKQAAFPKDGIIQQYMERLLYFVAWYNSCEFLPDWAVKGRSAIPNLAMTHFVITKDTCSLMNVKMWLQAWESCKEDWETRAISISLANSERAKKAQAVIARVITHATKSRRDWRILGTWAMEAASVPLSLREKWVKLFSLDIKSFTVYEQSGIELSALREHMERFLDSYSNSTMAHAVLERVRDLEYRNKVGINFAIGNYLNPDGSLPDIYAAQDRPFTFVDESVTAANKANAIAKAPSKEPKRDDYPTTGAYLSAKASWTLSISAKKQQEAAAIAATEKNTEAATKETNAISDAEDAELNGEDAEQFFLNFLAEKEQNYDAE